MSFTQAFQRHVRGFTLIELMIVIAIIGALAAFAIPNYRNYNMRANRSAAAQVMLAVQNREEQYILDARGYTNLLGTTGLNIQQQGWTCTNSSATGCYNNFYTVTVALSPDNTCTPPCGTAYTITARANTSSYQVADGDLTLTNAGIKTRVCNTTPGCASPSTADLKW